MTNSISSMKASTRLSLVGFTAVALILTSIPVLANAEAFYREMEVGMNGADISALQTFLATDPSIYPRGLVTGYFGPLTYAAVSNFQARNGISTVGRVGPITLATINGMFGSIGGSSDVNAPLISVITLGSSTSSISVTWGTNEETTSTLYYSTFPISLMESKTSNPYSVSVTGIPVASANFGLQRSHNVNVQNLQASTRYYFAIHATDQAGNVSVTWPSSLVTK